MQGQEIIEEQAELENDIEDMDSSIKKKAGGINNFKNNKDMKDIQQEMNDMNNQGYSNVEPDEDYDYQNQMMKQNGQENEFDSDQKGQYDQDEEDISERGVIQHGANHYDENRTSENFEDEQYGDDQDELELNYNEEEEDALRAKLEDQEKEKMKEQRRKEIEELKRDAAKLNEKTKIRPVTAKNNNDSNNYRHDDDDMMADDEEFEYIDQDIDNLERNNYNGERNYQESSAKKEDNMDINIAVPNYGYEDDELEVDENWNKEEFELYNDDKLKDIEHIDQFINNKNKEQQHLVTGESNNKKAAIGDKYADEYQHNNYNDDIGNQNYDEDNISQEVFDEEMVMDNDSGQIQQNDEYYNHGSSQEQQTVIKKEDGMENELDDDKYAKNFNSEDENVVQQDMHNVRDSEDMIYQEPVDDGMDKEGQNIYDNQEEDGEYGDEDEAEMGEEMIAFLNEIPVLEGESEEEMVEFQQKIFDVIVKYQLFNDEEFASLYHATVVKNSKLDEEFLKELFEEIANELQKQLQQTYEDGEGEYYEGDGEGDDDEYAGEEEEEEEEGFDEEEDA